MDDDPVATSEGCHAGGDSQRSLFLDGLLASGHGEPKKARSARPPLTLRCRM